MSLEESKKTQKQMVLVVDDEEVVRILFENLLQEEGLIPLLAEDGKTGVRLLDQHSPSVALVDKNLPDISGLELISSQRKRHPDTEFIMITGYASLDSAIKAMEMGAFSYLTKPFEDIDVVMDRIRAAMEVNQLRRETSHLRDRLKTISNADHAKSAPGAASPTSTASGKSQALERVQRTITFLESFLDKRAKPPTPGAWARIVDMLEGEVQALKEVVSKLKS